MYETDVRLEVNGIVYTGWTSCTIHDGLLQFSRDFTVSFTRTEGKGGLTIGITRGDKVKVYDGKDLLVTGYVSNLATSYTASDITLSVTGFSKTVDLVDCQVPTGKPLSFKKTPISSVVKMLSAHYGIQVVDEVKAVTVIDWDIGPTESIQSSLVNLLKQYSLLMTDNGHGDLLITKVGGRGRVNDNLETGKNILSATHSLSSKTLFSDFVVIGQGANPESERPVSDSQSIGTSSLGGIRKRFNVSIQSGNATVADLQKRARLLRDYNSGNAETYSCRVQGWRQSNGELWEKNREVRVIDKLLEIDRYYLISELSFSLSDSGTYTDLVLKPKTAFTETDLSLDKKKVIDYHVVKKGETADAKWTKEK